MKSFACPKCGVQLSTATPAYSGLHEADAVAKLASDHASKNGCDWLGVNIKKVLKK